MPYSPCPTTWRSPMRDSWSKMLPAISRKRAFIDQFFAKPFKSDNLEISDAFINKVVPEILSQSPEITDRGNPLDNYLAINRELRLKNSQTIRELAQKSKPAFLWNSPFAMMRNGKVMAAFADRRTYIYQGREIDRQDHLGFDLAVTKHAPVPAANSGTVVCARFFGIYGNAVVIDHGYGLQTHLRTSFFHFRKRRTADRQRSHHRQHGRNRPRGRRSPALLHAAAGAPGESSRVVGRPLDPGPHRREARGSISIPGELNFTFLFFMWVGASEAVSKLALGGPSALDFLLRLFPGASPQAGMDRAFGALRS